MKPNKNHCRFRNLLAIVAVACAVLLNAAGCTHHGTTPPAPAPPAPAPVAAVQHPTSVTIYHIANSKQQENQADHNGLVPITVPVPVDSLSPAKDALNRLANQVNGPLPKGTRILGLTIDNQTGLATADFSEEFQKNFSGGDTQEAQVISSVLQTLGQFPNIQNVQFLVNGQKIASLGGTQDLDEPLPVVRPDSAQTADKDSAAPDDNGRQ